MDNERATRHTILKQCKMDSINIPMRKGRLEEIEDDNEDPSIEMSSSQPSHVIYEKEEKIKIDYSGLNMSLQVILLIHARGAQILMLNIIGLGRKRRCQES